MKQKNVLGTDLQPCCYEPRTGFYRDGFCRTGPDDEGRHTVCVVMPVLVTGIHRSTSARVL